MMLTDTHPSLARYLWDDITDDESIMIVDGPAVKLYVTGGTREHASRKTTGQSLCVVDGPRDDPRTRYVHSVPRVVRHIIILSTHGNPSLDAQRFMADNEITWMCIDATGKAPRTLAISGQMTDPKFMRKQAMTAEGYPLEHIGLEIVRGFIINKLEGQAYNAQTKLKRPDIAAAIRARMDLVLTADSLESIRGYEGGAADAYWAAWKGLEPKWWKRVIKPTWLSYPGRKSLRRSETNRRATDPINALLNFAYHCAEVECVIACHAAGLDPRMGISHVDMNGRASFALDLIEVIRPRVDEVILEILGESLDPRLFWSDREGIVRVSAPLTHRIAAGVSDTRKYLTPAVKQVTDLLESAVM